MPLAADIARPLASLLGLLTLILALLLCGGNLADPAVDYLTMEAEEAQAIAVPLANILARQKWFRQYGRSLVNSDDAIALIFGIVAYAGRAVPVYKERLELRPVRERHTAGQTAGIPATQPPGATGANHAASLNGYAGLSGAYAADPAN